MNINRRDSFITTNWSGGTTTELRIMPEGALYSERQFDFRVSTATVDPGESRFTALPGVDRHLMILDGKIILRHAGMQDVFLEQFEQNQFDGGMTTVSFSQDEVVDFNLMLRAPYKGGLTYHRCDSELQIQGLKIEIDETSRYRDLYCVNGPVEMVIGNRSLRLFSGDYLQLQQREVCHDIAIMGKGDVIEINVWSE